MTKTEEAALEQFIQRTKEFLASDPYWMHVLTMPGGRAKRKQVAREFSKLMFTVPHMEKEDPFTRAVRRKHFK